MKRFKFTLESVHSLREMRREEAERALADANAKVARAAQDVEEAERARERAACESAESLQAAEINPFEAAMRADFLVSLAWQQQAARAALHTAECEHEARRKAVVEAARAAETTAKLRERERERYLLEAARAEQTMLDEMASTSMARMTEARR